MMRTQDTTHVVPESQDYNSQFSSKFSNPLDIGSSDKSYTDETQEQNSRVNRDDQSHKYAPRHIPATQENFQEDMRQHMRP